MNHRTIMAYLACFLLGALIVRGSYMWGYQDATEVWFDAVRLTETPIVMESPPDKWQGYFEEFNPASKGCILSDF